MKKIASQFACLFFAMSMIVTTQAQNATQATVVANFTPPYTTPLSELYTSNQLNIIVTALDGPIPSGKISVIIQGDNGIRLQNNYITSPFSLDIAQGQPSQLLPGDIDEIFQRGSFTATGITVNQAFDQGLPPGNYEMCFRVYAQSRTIWVPLSQAPPIGCSTFIIPNTFNNIIVNTIVQPPPFMPELSEYQYKINANITSTTSREVRLYLTIKGDNGVTIQSKQGVITPETISLQAGVPYMLSSIDLGPYFDFPNLVFSGISPNVVFNNGLPEGNYRFCIRLVDTNGNFISGEDPAGCSNLVSIKLLEPPQLMNPMCGTAVNATPAQNILFTWTPPPGAPPGLVYTLRIVEMLDPSKNPNDAMLSATTPAFFEETIVGATTFLYGPGQPLLEPGRKYAWQVIAGTSAGADFANITHLFRNGGKSVVCWFTYENNTPLIGIPVLAQTPDNKKQGPPGNTVPNTYGFTPQDIFVFNSIVKGKLNYQFALGTKQPLANTNIKLVITYVRKQGDKITVLKPQHQGQGTPMKYKDMDKVLAITKTDAAGNFTFLCTLKDEDLPKAVEAVLIIDQKTGATSSGSFVTYKTARVVVESPYMLSPEDDITLKKDATIDAGDLSVRVREYALKVNVVSKNIFNNSAFKAGELPDKLNNYTVYLLRQTRPLGVPDLEGLAANPRDTKKGMEVIGKSTSNADAAALLLRLVKNAGPNDKYFLYAESKPENLTNFYCEPTPVAFNFDKTPAAYKVKVLNGVTKDEAIYGSEYTMPGVEFNLLMKAHAGEISGTVRRKDNQFEGIPGAEVRMWQLEDKTVNGTLVKKQDQLAILPFIPPFYSGTTSGGGVIFDYTTKKLISAPVGNFYIGNIYPTLKYEGGTLTKQDPPLRPLRVTKYGYRAYSELVPEILMGQRKHIDVQLEPAGGLKGEVVNEKGEYIMAQVSVPGGKSVSTQLGGFVSKPSGINGMYLTYPTKSVFDVMAPLGMQKLSVVPFDLDAYLPYDTMINVTKDDQDVGKIKLYDNAYRVQVHVTEYTNSNATTYTFYLPGAAPKPSGKKEIQGAKVSIQYISDAPVLTSSKGVANFKFKSMATKFNITVEPPDGQLYQAAYATATAQQLSKSKKDYFVVEVALKKAAQISGKVTVGNSPIGQAKVSVKVSGADGTMTPLEVPTNDDGTYTLKNIPMNVPLEISAVKGKSQYIGDVKTVTLTKQLNDGIDFNLTQYNGIVLTELLGIPVEIQALEESGDMIKLTGSFIEPPLLKGFTQENTNPLSFSSLEVTKSDQKNAQGVSYAKPVGGKVPVDLAELVLKMNNKLIVKQPATNDVLEIADNGQGKGVLEGPTYVDITNFAVNNITFPATLIRLATGTGTNQKLAVRTISAAAITPPDKYYLVDEQGKDLSLKFHDFTTTAKSSQSYIDGENLRLNCVLHTNLAHLAPADIKLDIGEVVITPTGAGDIVNRPPFDIAMGSWKVNAAKWSISSAGFKVQEGTLKAGVVDVPFTGLTLYPLKLHDDAKYNLSSLSFNNIVSLKTTGEASFGFDNTKNLWSLRVDAKNTTYAAVMDNLPLIKSNEAFFLSSIALYSDGTSLIMTDKNVPPVTLYDLSTFEATDIQITGDNVKLLGQLDLHLAQVGKLSSGINYKKQGGNLTGSIIPATFNFTSNAVKVNIPIDNETFSPGKFEATGIVFEDTKFNFNVKLTHTKTSSVVELIPGQSYQLTEGKKSYLTKLAGSMKVVNDTWNELYFEGDLTGTEGASGRLGFTVKGDWVASDQKIGVKNVPTDFGGIALTYNFEEGRLEGSLHYDKDVSSSQHIKGDATAIVDGTGWHFVSTGALSMTNPKAEGQAGIVFGDYSMTPEIKQLFEGTSFVFQKAGHLPEIFPQAVKGFYFEGGISLPVPVIPSVDFDYGLVSGHLYVNIGGDMRNSMQFSDGLTYGVGQSIFADAGVGLGGSVVLACAGCSANVLAMVNFDGQFSTGGNWFVDGEGLITLTGSTYAGWGVCDSDCDGMFCDKSSESASVTFGVHGHYGTDYKKIEFYKK